MARTKYFIKNKIRGGYYQKNIFIGQKHFVLEYKEAKAFVSRKLANNVLNDFNNKDSYEIVAIKYE